LHAISWRLHTRGEERQRYKRNGVQTAREAARQWACWVHMFYICAMCQWHGAGRAKWPFLRCGTPFPGDCCITQATNGRGIKETAFKPPGEQPVGLLGACVLNLCQWHGAGRANWPFLRCGTPFRPPPPPPCPPGPTSPPPPKLNPAPRHAHYLAPPRHAGPGPILQEDANHVEGLPSACHCPP
jgi:hypothetical protein